MQNSTAASSEAKQRDFNPFVLFLINKINSIGIKENINITPKNANCKNYAFDVTPAKFITKIITEKEVVDPNQKSISKLIN